MNKYETEMQTAVRDLIAERTQLKTRIRELELELQILTQMHRTMPVVSVVDL